MRRQPREEARRARNDVYRQHILEAAERIFAEHGFEAAKVQHISKLAGLSMGTIYAVFPSKTDIFRASLEERGRELLALAEDVARTKAGPREALSALIEGYIDYFLANPNWLRMHLSLGTSWAARPSGTDSRAAQWGHVLALQADIFRRGIANGIFVDEDPLYLSKMFSVMDRVLLSDWVAGGMKEDRDTLIRRLQDMAERAFSRPAGSGRVSAARSA